MVAGEKILIFYPETTCRLKTVHHPFITKLHSFLRRHSNGFASLSKEPILMNECTNLAFVLDQTNGVRPLCFWREKNEWVVNVEHFHYIVSFFCFELCIY